VTLDAAHLSNIEAPREFDAALLSFCRASHAAVATARCWAR